MRTIYKRGTAVAQWLRYCATNRKVAVSTSLLQAVELSGCAVRARQPRLLIEMKQTSTIVFSTVVERQNTLACQFDQRSPRITAVHIHEWIHATMNLTEDDVSMI
jgi:hypothetical protein